MTLMSKPQPPELAAKEAKQGKIRKTPGASPSLSSQRSRGSDSLDSRSQDSTENKGKNKRHKGVHHTEGVVAGLTCRQTVAALTHTLTEYAPVTQRQKRKYSNLRNMVSHHRAGTVLQSRQNVDF